MLWVEIRSHDQTEKPYAENEGGVHKLKALANSHFLAHNISEFHTYQKRGNWACGDAGRIEYGHLGDGGECLSKLATIMSIINLLFPINVVNELSRPQVIEMGGGRHRAQSGKQLKGASNLSFHSTNRTQPALQYGQHQFENHQKPQDDETQDPTSCPSTPRRGVDNNTSPAHRSTPQPVCNSDQHQLRLFDQFLNSLNMTSSERDLLEELSRGPETPPQPHDPAPTLDQAVDNFFDDLDADEPELSSPSRTRSQWPERGSAVRATRLTREDFLAMESLFASSSTSGL